MPPLVASREERIQTAESLRLLDSLSGIYRGSIFSDSSTSCGNGSIGRRNDENTCSGSTSFKAKMKFSLADLFGRKNSKVVFNARQPPEEIVQNPGIYSYVHNFKVHYKRSKIQTEGNKLDTSVSSESPQIPSQQEVILQFNQRMMSLENDSKFQTPRNEIPSVQITSVEYKVSLGMKQNVSNDQRSLLITRDTFCRRCGNSMSSDSKFCSKCGTLL